MIFLFEKDGPGWVEMRADQVVEDCVFGENSVIGHPKSTGETAFSVSIALVDMRDFVLHIEKIHEYPVFINAIEKN